MVNPDSKYLSDNFNVCVKIIEAKDLPHSNITSMVSIQVGNQKKCTRIVKNTNKPYFDEYFVFEIYTNYYSFMSTAVTISIVQPRKKFKLNKLVGCISFDIGIVWFQPYQRLQNWLPVTVPSDVNGQVKGMLKCEIRIEAAAEYRPSPELKYPRSLFSEFGKRLRYGIKVYKCVGLSVQEKEDALDVSVRVIFAGKVGNTTTRKKRASVEWNEQITFIAIFPPLFHKLTIELVVGKSVLVSKHFFLLEILKYFEGSNQHIFGPNYVHLYKNEYFYCGSLFMAIETNNVGVFKKSEKPNGITTLPIESLPQQTFGYLENYLCFGVLFDAMLNGRTWSGTNIQLSLIFGSTENNATDESMNHPLTDHFKAVPGNSDFCYLPLNEHKPCIFVRPKWPDNNHRLFNSNMISNITDKLRESITVLQELIERNQIFEAKNILKTSINDFKKDCQKLSQSLIRGINDLDFGRVKFLSNFFNLKLPHLASSIIQENNLEIVLEKLVSILDFVNELCEDIQESLPCIILSLKQNQTVIGSSKVDPKQIIFSKKTAKRGRNCGKIISLFIKTANNKLVGRLDTWLWLGFWDEVSYCLKDLPPGHEDLSKIVSLPGTLTYDKFERYSVYCRVYSGCIADISNIAENYSVFVRIFCSNQSQQTKAIKRSMAPIWKETLILSDIRLYPTPTYIHENPPLLTIELWNQANNSSNLIGVELVQPSHLERIQAETEFKIQWYQIGDKSQILSAFEIVQISTKDDDPFSINKLRSVIPKAVDPITVPFRLEVVFWGIRPVDVAGLNQNIVRVQAIIQCSTSELKSNILTRTLTSLNFQRELHILPLELPRVFSPPLIMQIISDNIFLGCSIKKNVHHYEYNLPTKNQWRALYIQRKSLVELAESRHSSHVPIPDLIPLMEINSKTRSLSDEGISCGFIQTVKGLFNRFKPIFLKHLRRVSAPIISRQNIIEEEEYDWWFGYYSGVIKIYTNELEKQTEFNGFNDVLETYSIKQANKGRIFDTMKVKTMMCLYEWPTQKELVTMEGQDPTRGVLRLTELRDRVKLLVRVYCIRAHNLIPSDPNGLSDPFIELATPSNCISDKNNYIPKTLNPVFGRCLEIPAILPTDSILAVRVLDWDMLTASDFIGETIIDIENRFYSKHRGTCGLPQTYDKTGFNSWRDTEKPTDILEKLCNTYSLPLPQYYEKSVLIGSKEFVFNKTPKNKDDIKDKLALMVLNRWSEVPFVGRPLVPQHVETRSLYIKDKPGLERGKLELWVDLFDQSYGEIPPPIYIQPQEPQLYELRVVILNTAKVPLVDDTFFVGKKHTDIFVKGWLWDPNDSQTTDVHYTSINGTGNFNWRFIFQFLYFKQEKRMVIYKKDLFRKVKAESKVPALLHLQVWDSDRISPNDFIGATVLELCRMPRGSMSVATCSPKHYLNPSNTVDLFKIKRLRGWWPFFQMTNEGEQKSAGFLEAEFHLLTQEGALINPAGLGRSAPNALPVPLRPDIKIKFWLAPFRALSHYICSINKGKILMCGFVTAIVLFIFFGVYSIPVFIVKRILGA